MHEMAGQRNTELTSCFVFHFFCSDGHRSQFASMPGIRRSLPGTGKWLFYVLSVRPRHTATRPSCRDGSHGSLTILVKILFACHVDRGVDTYDERNQLLHGTARFRGIFFLCV